MADVHYPLPEAFGVLYRQQGGTEFPFRLAWALARAARDVGGRVEVFRIPMRPHLLCSRQWMIGFQAETVRTAVAPTFVVEGRGVVVVRDDRETCQKAWGRLLGITGGARGPLAGAQPEWFAAPGRAPRRVGRGRSS